MFLQMWDHNAVILKFLPFFNTSKQFASEKKDLLFYILSKLKFVIVQ